MALLLSGFICGSGGTAYGAESSGKLPASQRKQLKAAIQVGFGESSAPGVIVGVRSPKGTLIKTVGVADPASQAPVRATMSHRAGSVTKTFIGTLLMQLVGEGRLSLNDTISEYVAGVPNGETITLRQLANMTSGLSSYTASDEWLNLLYADPHRVWNTGELLPFGYPDSPLFPPGSKFQYSDSNYTLLGLVIREVTGRSVGAALRSRIIEPLGLRHTFYPGRSARLPEPYWHGYTLQGQPANQPGDATNWNPSYAGAAGAIVSKVRDLLVYARALGTGKGLLKPRLQRKRIASLNPVSVTTPPVAYGIGLADDGGWIGHNGSVPGYTSTVYYLPSTKTAVVVETNSDISSGTCPGGETLLNDPFAGPCASAADHIMASIAEALGTPYRPL